MFMKEIGLEACTTNHLPSLPPNRFLSNGRKPSISSIWRFRTSTREAAGEAQAEGMCAENHRNLMKSRCFVGDFFNTGLALLTSSLVKT